MKVDEPVFMRNQLWARNKILDKHSSQPHICTYRLSG